MPKLRADPHTFETSFVNLAVTWFKTSFLLVAFGTTSVWAVSTLTPSVVPSGSLPSPADVSFSAEIFQLALLSRIPSYYQGFQPSSRSCLSKFQSLIFGAWKPLFSNFLESSPSYRTNCPKNLKTFFVDFPVSADL